jgi:hypothetical protein
MELHERGVAHRLLRLFPDARLCELGSLVEFLPLSLEEIRGNGRARVLADRQEEVGRIRRATSTLADHGIRTIEQLADKTGHSLPGREHIDSLDFGAFRSALCSAAGYNILSDDEPFVLPTESLVRVYRPNEITAAVPSALVFETYVPSIVSNSDALLVRIRPCREERVDITLEGRPTTMLSARAMLNQACKDRCPVMLYGQMQRMPDAKTTLLRSDVDHYRFITYELSYDDLALDLRTEPH